MGNLGWYQWFTTTAKKVGGPKILLGLVAAGGYVIIGTAVKGGKTIYKLVKKNSKSSKVKSKQFLFLVDGENGNGLKFSKEDSFIVVAEHNDAILLEKLGDRNNPYFVDLPWLKSVSNYEVN